MSVVKLLPQIARQTKGLLVFGGDIVRSGPIGGFRSAKSSAEAHNGNPTFSWERVLAASLLSKQDPKMVIVPSGGKSEFFDDSAPRISTVMSGELRSFGVPSGSIIEESESSCTLEQIVNCSAIAREKGWKIKDIAILAPSWQFPRIAALIQALEHADRNIAPITPNVTFISMERVLVTLDPSPSQNWGEYFKGCYPALVTMNMMWRELMGTAQILCGWHSENSGSYRGVGDPLRRHCR